MLAPITSTKIEYDIKTYKSHRNHRVYEPDRSTKIKTTIGAVTGTLIPMFGIANIQKTNILNIKYGVKEMLIVSAGSIIGGLFAGLMSDRKENHTQKLHESVFQFMNASVPAILTGSLFTLSKKFNTLNNNTFKLGSTAIGLFGGMHIAAKISNKINDPHDKIPDRKLTYKDAIANVDDALGALDRKSVV